MNEIILYRVPFFIPVLYKARVSLGVCSATLPVEQQNSCPISYETYVVTHIISGFDLCAYEQKVYNLFFVLQVLYRVGGLACVPE